MIIVVGHSGLEIVRHEDPAIASAVGGDGLEVLSKYVVKVWTVTIMARHEGWSRRRPKDMKMTSVEKTVSECGSAQLKGARE